MNKKILLGAILSSALVVPSLMGNSVYCRLEVEKQAHANEKYEENQFSQQETPMVNSSEVKSTLGLTAKSSILVDGKTGKIIYGDNYNEKLPIASMTKMMTLLLVMEEIDKGNLRMDSDIIISEYAASQEGSECFLDAGKEYKLAELIKSVAVASANDSAVAIAEAVSGSEEMFAKKMNDRAKELGMNSTSYKNATGLDIAGHYSTAYDLTKVIKALSKYSAVCEMGKTWMYDMGHFGGRVTGLTNTNRLVRTDKNLILAKTGHTDAAGYCITTYSRVDDTDLIACVMGLNDSKVRFDEVSKLNAYGFSNFETREIISENEVTGAVPIKGGKQTSVNVHPSHSIYKLVPKGEKLNITSETELVDVIKAPIAAGEKLGTMRIIIDNANEEVVDLVAENSVDEITYGEITRKILEA